jgi:prepilin-type N-terminal cleavage/methylation domain-containing protein
MESIVPLNRSTCRAFTLIELLSAIAIIGLLAGLLLPAYKATIVRADTSKSLSQMRGIGQAFLTFSAENGGTLPCAFGWPERFGIYEKPAWVAGTIGKDWGDDMWIWALVNSQSLSIQAFTSPQTDKQLKTLGFGPYPAFMLNQSPAMPEAVNKAYFIPARFVRPAKTILLSQVGFDQSTIGNRASSYCNYWGDWGIMHAVVNETLGIKKAPYIFMDGHAEVLSPSETLGSEATNDKGTTRWFDPSMFPNTWFSDEAAAEKYLRKRLL